MVLIKTNLSNMFTSMTSSTENMGWCHRATVPRKNLQFIAHINLYKFCTKLPIFFYSQKSFRETMSFWQWMGQSCLRYFYSERKIPDGWFCLLVGLLSLWNFLLTMNCILLYSIVDCPIGTIFDCQWLS